MPVETSYAYLRKHLAAVLDRVVNDQEPIIVRRGSGKDVAIIPASELSGLLETLHLLRSPRNAARLLRALRRAERRQLPARTVEELRRDIKAGKAN